MGHLASLLRRSGFQLPRSITGAPSLRSFAGCKTTSAPSLSPLTISASKVLRCPTSTGRSRVRPFSITKALHSSPTRNRALAVWILFGAVLLTTSRRGGFGGRPPISQLGITRPLRDSSHPSVTAIKENVDTRLAGCPCFAQRLPARTERENRLVDVGPIVKSHAQATEEGEKTCSWELLSFWNVSLGCPSATSKERFVGSSANHFHVVYFTEVVFDSVVYGLSGRAWQFLFLVM